MTISIGGQNYQVDNSQKSVHLIAVFEQLFNKKKNDVPFPFYMKGRDDVIFIHIIKSAGTSITKGLDFNPPQPQANLNKHWHAREIENVIGTEKWNSAYKFAMVRNPWERLVSFYKYQLRKPHFHLAKHPIEFAEWLEKTIGPEPDYLYEGHLGRLFKPQSYWLKDKSGEININFIGRFESLESDFQTLCNNIKVNQRTLPQINMASTKEDMGEWYDDQGKELVSTFYKEDFERFGYKSEF